VSYGAETWTRTKKEEQSLLVFERKIFRRIYGPKYENGEWKTRTNEELEEMSKGENIVKWIKGQRISWLGSTGQSPQRAVVPMEEKEEEEDLWLSKVFNYKLETF
jgi:hypothetical protein